MDHFVEEIAMFPQSCIILFTSQIILSLCSMIIRSNNEKIHFLHITMLVLNWNGRSVGWEGFKQEVNEVTYINRILAFLLKLKLTLVKLIEL